MTRSELMTEDCHGLTRFLTVWRFCCTRRAGRWNVMHNETNGRCTNLRLIYPYLYTMFWYLSILLYILAYLLVRKTLLATSPISFCFWPHSRTRTIKLAWSKGLHLKRIENRQRAQRETRADFRRCLSCFIPLQQSYHISNHSTHSYLLFSNLCVPAFSVLFGTLSVPATCRAAAKIQGGQNRFFHFYFPSARN